MDSEFSSDASTIALWHMNGSVGSSEKKDNAQGNATWDLLEHGSPVSGSGYDGATDGTYSTGVTYTASNFTAFDPTALSIEFWVKNTSPTGSYEFLISLNDGGTETFSVYQVDAFDVHFNVRTAGGSRDLAIANTTLYDGDWHYVAFTILASGSMTIYVDGASVGAQSALGNIITTNPAPLGIAGWGTSPASYAFSGDIDEVRISSIERSAAEIAAIVAPVSPSVVLSGFEQKDSRSTIYNYIVSASGATNSYISTELGSGSIAITAAQAKKLAGVTAGETIIVQGEIFADDLSGGRQAAIDVKFFDDSGVSQGSITSITATESDVWQGKKAAIVVPSGATRLNFYLRSTCAASEAIKVWIANLRMYR